MATKAQLRQRIADLENFVRDLEISRELWKAVDPSRAQDLVLSLAPEIRQSPKPPRKTRDLDTVAAELIEEAGESEEGRAALSKYGSELADQHAALQRRYKAHQDASRELVRTAGGLIGDHQRLLKAEKALEDAQARLEAEKAAHALTTDVAREIISDLVLDRIGK